MDQGDFASGDESIEEFNFWCHELWPGQSEPNFGFGEQSYIEATLVKLRVTGPLKKREQLQIIIISLTSRLTFEDTLLVINSQCSYSACLTYIIDDSK